MPSEVADGVRQQSALTCEVAGSFAGHEAVVGPLMFSADGKRLVSGGWDTTILVWDVQGLPRDRGTKPAPLSPKERAALWAELGSADAARAYRAVRTLIRAGEPAASFLADRLQPIPAADAQEITRLIADLDSERFTVRAKAEGELEKLAERAEPALRRALEGKPPSLEFRRRIERLLQRVQGRSPRRSSCASSGRLRFWNASALRGCNPCGGWPPARREHG